MPLTQVESYMINSSGSYTLSNLTISGNLFISSGANVFSATNSNVRIMNSTTYTMGLIFGG